MGRLDELRDDIDRVDEVLVRLLNERARVACEIGRIKKDLGWTPRIPELDRIIDGAWRWHQRHPRGYAGR